MSLVLVPLEFDLVTILKNTSRSSSKVMVMTICHHHQWYNCIQLLEIDPKEILGLQKGAVKLIFVVYALSTVKSIRSSKRPSVEAFCCLVNIKLFVIL